MIKPQATSHAFTHTYENRSVTSLEVFVTLLLLRLRKCGRDNSQSLENENILPMDFSRVLNANISWDVVGYGSTQPGKGKLVLCPKYQQKA